MTTRRFALLLSAAIAPTLMSCSRANGAAPLPVREAAQVTLAVKAAAPLARLDGETSRATGELRSKLQATLSAKVSGTILKVHVQPGDRVKKGAPLVELDPALLVIQLDQARAAKKMAVAARANASAELKRTRQLFEAGSAPPAVMDKVQAGADQAEATVEQADAQVRLLEQNLRDHTVRAPFDGIVTARMRNVGDYLAMMPPTPVATLVAVDSVEARLAVPEGLVEPLRPGVTLQGRTLPGGLPFSARVTSVGATVDPATRAVEVLAEVRAKTDARGAIRPGGLVEVDLGASGAGQGPFVPAQAVGRDGERRFVWVVEGEVVHRRDVRVDPVTPQWSRVREGIRADEQVVVEGATGLAEGVPVAVSR